MIKSFWILTKENSKLIRIAALIFITSIFLGYIVNPYNEIILESFEKLNEMAKEISEKENMFFTIKTIFLNNIAIAVLAVLLGVVFGIYPILMLFFNGLFIGIFIKMFVEEQSLIVLILGLLPHGIFELTAIILAAAYGMKLGFSLFKIIIKRFKGEKNNSSREVFLKTLNKTFVYLIGITLLLFVAAIIEGTISLFIIKKISEF